MKNIQKEISTHLKDFFGFKKFKGNQKDAIQSVLEGNDTFVIMPTGGGKSLCYQLPAIMMDGVAIIISPLIALMKNQVDSIRSYASNDDIAHFFNSSLSKNEKEYVKKCVLNKKTKLLFLAPETINQESNTEFLKKCHISFYAIDEAHCISEWGHDFRPEYRKLRQTINRIGKKPIIALTATATKKVQADMIKNLGIEKKYNLFTSSFNRPNLYYEINTKENINRDIIKYIKKNNGKSGIIYCLERKKAEEIAYLLSINNIKSLPYHAGLDKKIRMDTQDAFLMEDIDVVVATIAFGMGIDKPDVRYVIHYNLPKSLENYYQETGRAGRDGGEGQCILFYDKADAEKFKLFNGKKVGTEKSIASSLLNEMIEYIESNDCRRERILNYFGEKNSNINCDKYCDNCNKAKQIEEQIPNTLLHDTQLLVILKNLRKKMANEKSVPPFIIFQDPSLEDMATQYPITLEELKNITGVGEGKAKKYGNEFLTIIQKYVKDNNIQKIEDYVIKSKAKKNDLKIFIIQSVDRKLPFEDIMSQKKLELLDLIKEFENIVNAGTKINIDYHINEMLDDVQQDEIKEYFMNETLNGSMHDAIEYFDNDYEDEELRLIKIKLLSDLAN